MVVQWAGSDVAGLSLQLSHFHSLPLGPAGCRRVYILVNVGQLWLAQGFNGCCLCSALVFLGDAGAVEAL